MSWLVLSHQGGRSSDPCEAMVADLLARGWRKAPAPYGLAALVRGPNPPPITAIPGFRGTGAVLVGELFDAAAAQAGEGVTIAASQLAEALEADPQAACRVLARQAFGDYALVVRRQGESGPMAFSEPLGGLPCFGWIRDGVTIIGPAPPDGLAAPLGVSVDWPVLAALMADRRRSGGAPPLDGVTWIEPGTCRWGRGLSDVSRLWSPAEAARPQNRRPDLAALRRVVDGTVAALALGQERILCEISGGLDSAIVATSLRAQGRAPDLALNFYRGQAEADERVYAQAAAERAGAPLRCVERPLLAFEEETLLAGAAAFRPNFEILDADFDRLALEVIGEVGAQAVFTGHGGDVVFYQLSAAELGVDLLTGAPCRGARLARLAEVARRTRRSVWSLAAQAITGRPGRRVAELMAAQPVLAPDKPAGPPHPWMAQTRGLSAAKRAQIAGLAVSQGLSATTLRGQAARLRHPLFAQPVVEACLAIPPTLLSQGEGERSFARAAFAERLPPSIVARRSKGDISVFLGRSLAANTPMLRGFLLDGRLVAEGIIDRADLDAILSPEVLIFRDVAGEILAAIVLEAFVRYWEARGEAASDAPAAGVLEPSAPSTA
ncbi:asparagine synthase-related protein [Caulobacter hibisci]|uniref:Asparagine synthase n=1 Tax=Caulobacter hibisci TaxID=2035993 RepID=A0ABS0T4I1_9CAUL|nr:asparagine synthase C-terminal domain-containing protein [Caulobacter hibisci]MBI1686792.1 asparagine synthase [Caulobacter hibisci]